jgi:thymidylate synthase ThyX
MAKKNGIRIRISNQRVVALQEICEEMLEEFKPGNEHQQLLREYLSELQERLQEMQARGQDLYTLSLCGSEATAFYQLWNMLDISRDKYANLIVDNLLKKMSSLAA